MIKDRTDSSLSVLRTALIGVILRYDGDLAVVRCLDGIGEAGDATANDYEVKLFD